MTKKAPSPLETKEEAKTQVWSCSSSDARTRSAGLCEKCRSAFLADPQPSSLPSWAAAAHAGAGWQTASALLCPVWTGHLQEEGDLSQAWGLGSEVSSWLVLSSGKEGTSRLTGERR